MAEFGIAIKNDEHCERSPFDILSKKLAMWLFIVSDTVTFGALLYGCGYLRNASSNWPTPFHFFPSIFNVMLMTFLLVTSSLTMAIAVHKSRACDKETTLKWMSLTIILGLLFAALHVHEWLTLMHEGMGLSHNPWGSPQFGATFFSITGLHLLHVIGGVIALSVVALGYMRGRYNSSDIETWGLYWHFVEVVWIFIVPMMYLLNIQK